ncbi:MAG: hypothetical protein R3C61_00990 [Bacteroidia bacterium]
MNRFSPQRVINWRNSGKRFTSAEDLQPEESYFEIVEEEAYQNNEKGEKVRRLRVRMSCGHLTEQSSLRDAGGWIGVILPGKKIQNFFVNWGSENKAGCNL